jgi:hypothetical protein
MKIGGPTIGLELRTDFRRRSKIFALGRRS